MDILTLTLNRSSDFTIFGENLLFLGLKYQITLYFSSQICQNLISRKIWVVGFSLNVHSYKFFREITFVVNIERHQIWFRVTNCEIVTQSWFHIIFPNLYFHFQIFLERVKNSSKWWQILLSNFKKMQICHSLSLVTFFKNFWLIK